MRGQMKFGGGAAWMITFGLGLGVIVGVILASGIGFSKADAARFVGAMFGSLIAVAGAIFLVFLKEARDIEARRKRMDKHIRRLITASTSMLWEMAKGSKASASTSLVVAEIDRTLRFAENHEFDDEVISECRLWLAPLRVTGVLERLAENDWTHEAEQLEKGLWIVARAGNNALKAAGWEEIDIEGSIEGAIQRDQLK